MSLLTNSDYKAPDSHRTSITTCSEAPLFPNSSTLHYTSNLPAQEIHRRALAARALQGKAHHLLARWLLEMEERALYREFGCSSVYMYAGLHLHLEGHTVAEYLRTGRSLRKYPLLAEAYEQGTLSASKLREITRVVTSQTEAHWLEVARTSTTRQIEKMVVFSPRRGTPQSVASSPARAVEISMPGFPSPLTGAPAGTLDPTVGPGSTGESHRSTGTGMSDGNGTGEFAAGVGVTDSGLDGPPRFLHCRPDCGLRPGHADTLTCSGERETPPAPPALDARHYLEKMVLELSAEQAAIIHDALREARKEGGARDRASQFAYMARVFLERGRAVTKGRANKPPYQVVVYHHPGSGVSWTESAQGPVYMPPALFERALCDAEVVEPAQGGHEKEQQVMDHRTAEDPALSGRETGVERGGMESGSLLVQPSPVGFDERDRSETSMAHVNRLYQVYRERGRSRKRNATVTGGRDGMSPDAEKGERGGKKEAAGKKKQGRTGTIPAALRKKALLRDGGRCNVPGCGRAEYVEVHHLKPRGVCGEHVLDELTVLCQACHQAVHEGRLVIEGNAPGRLIFRKS